MYLWGMLSVQQLSVYFGGTVLFEDLNFQVNTNDRIGLAGRNGAGKSTLMKIIAGIQVASEGSVNKPKEFRIGYLPQEFAHQSQKPVREEAAEAFAEVLALDARLKSITEELQTREDYESDGYLKLIEDLNTVQERFDLLEGNKIEERLERVLKGLGFLEEDLDRPMSSFSGGWQMRVELAKLLLIQPDLLLLDEPTNHLDMDSIIWLEQFLAAYPGAIMMISHDKQFLDSLTNRTIEITGGKIEDYKAAYSKYLVLRKERREQLLNAKKNQDKEIARMERNIERFRAKASKASFAQSLQKKLDRTERIEIDEEAIRSMQIRFPEPPRSGKVVVEAKGVAKSYGDKKVIAPFTFSVDSGDRIAFVGKNGMGKTTLSRIIAGDLDYNQGHLELGHNVALGYFAQHQTERLRAEHSILEEMEMAANQTDRFSQVRGILGAFLFSGEEVEKKIKVLSGGEKARVSLAKLLLEPINFLILDEPTNHLDIISKDVLKQALKHFPGTLIVVSHDREFLQGLTTKTLEFTPEGIKTHLGDIDEFLSKKQLDSFRTMEQQKQSAETKKGSPSEPSDYHQKREAEKQQRKLQSQLKRAEEKVQKLEAQLALMDKELLDPERFKERSQDAAYFERYNGLKKELEKAMADWEAAMAALEN